MEGFTLPNRLIFQTVEIQISSTNLIPSFKNQGYLLSLYRAPYPWQRFSLQLNPGLSLAYYFEQNDDQEPCFKENRQMFIGINMHISETELFLTKGQSY